MFSQILVDRGHEELHVTEEEMAAEPGDDDEAEDFVMAKSQAGLPAITNRRGAYALLDYAADWLLRYEPHSPAPYLVKRAVSWEHRSLREILAELMARGADQATIFETLGMEESDSAEMPRRQGPGKSPIRE